MIRSKHHESQHVSFHSTIFEKDLEKHLKSRCNARPRELPVCHSLNVNCTLPLSEEELEFQRNIYSHQKMFVQPWLARVQLHELAREDLDSIISKVTAAYDANVAPIPMEQLTHPSSEKKRYAQLARRSALVTHWSIEAPFRIPNI